MKNKLKIFTTLSIALTSVLLLSTQARAEKVTMANNETSGNFYTDIILPYLFPHEKISPINRFNAEMTVGSNFIFPFFQGRIGYRLDKSYNIFASYSFNPTMVENHVVEIIPPNGQFYSSGSYNSQMVTLGVRYYNIPEDSAKPLPEASFNSFTQAEAGIDFFKSSFNLAVLAGIGFDWMWTDRLGMVALFELGLDVGDPGITLMGLLLRPEVGLKYNF